MDDNGTFADDDIPAGARATRQDAGLVLFQLYEWPRIGPVLDFTPTETVRWDDEGVGVYLEDLFD